MGINSFGLNKTLLRAALVAGLAWTSSTGYSQVVWEIGPAPVRPASPSQVPPAYAPSPSPYESRTFSNLPNSQVMVPAIRQSIPSPASNASTAETVVASPAFGSAPASTSPSRGNGLLPQPALIPPASSMGPSGSAPAYTNPSITSSFSNTTSSSNRTSSTVVAAPQQHLPSGSLRSIDVSKLSPDILNCDVCRSRLGLPPLQKQPHPSSNVPANSPSSSAQSPAPSNFFELSEAKPMLGSPGLLSAGTGKRLEESGMVVEEFRPPQPKPEDFQLDNLPPEARQQFYQGLDLPRGARVMSAQLIDGVSRLSPSSTPSPDISNPTPNPTPTNPEPTNRPSSVLGEEIPKLDMPALIPPKSLVAPGTPPTQVPAIPQPPSAPRSPESIAPAAVTTNPPTPATSPSIPQPNRQDSISTDDVAVASPVTANSPSNKEPVTKDKSDAPEAKAEPSSQSQDSLPALGAAPVKQVPAPMNPDREAELQKVIQVLRDQNANLASEMEKLRQANVAREEEWMRMLKNNDASLNEQKKILDQQQELEMRVRAQTEVFESKLMELEKQNKTIAQMLEARTAEVTELQNKLRAAENRAKREGNSKEGSKPKSKPKNGDSDSANQE